MAPSTRKRQKTSSDFLPTTKGKMKEVIVAVEEGKPISTYIHDVPIPAPGPNEVLIKVAVSGSNPKDWKHPKGLGRPHNPGDDISGTLISLGSSVSPIYGLQPSTRVAAFHVMGSPHGSYAEYAIAPASTTFPLPSNTSFESGATLPLAAMTAALGLFTHLRLPAPWTPLPASHSGPTTPLLIYGGAAAVGSFAIKLAKLSGLGPVVAVCGDSCSLVQELLNPKDGDVVVDYRKGNVVSDIKAALKGKGELRYALDVTCGHGSWETCLELLAEGSGEKGYSHLNMLDLPDEKVDWPVHVEITRTFVASAYGEAHPKRGEGEAKADRDFAFAFYRYMSLLLEEGRFTGHPYEVMPKGLASVGEGIQMLYDHKVHGKKLVYRIEDTPGL